MVAFELAVQDTHGLAIAARLGVDRIELCSALPLGGLTPSLAFIEAAVATPGIPPVHVLIRPRPGGFDYEPGEVSLMVRDVRHAVAAGASGVVIGGVRAGRADVELIGGAKQAAGTAEITFHRAFDTLADPAEAIDTLVELAVTRILTSGGAASAGDALPELARLVDTAGGRIEVMAGGGVRPEMVRDLLAAGVAAVHASGKGIVAEKTQVTLGSAAPGGESGRETTDEREVEQLLAALRSQP
ncbi:copper homeostasis protein CutC [Paractinoplanes ferrugineus]|uniref:PF03932 family protein CutC n=1 Tax=Paractinoplanes ferrugineus TaxID=113564 RepID=A0A919IZ86_9ACTN|nr:copper homeostasis protein CutC [Actinoplanes ferrugineus]GIE10602.1 copper homeostasis protein CutC [Actinoplanes ferrugineus]